MKTHQENLEIRYLNPTELKLNPKNSRTHSKKQLHKIAQSIEKLGFNNPVLVDTEDVIIAGHGRVLAARDLGLTEIPTICLSHMTQEQIRAYIIADNKLAEEAGWDNEILKIELDFLMNLESEIGFDATITGFDIPQLDLILNPEVLDVVKDASKKDSDTEFLENIIDIPKRVQKGDLWKLGEHLLYCGNSLEEISYKKLLQNELAQVVFTDPPYNVKIKGNVTKQKQHEEFELASGEMKKGEFIDFLKTAMNLQAKYSIDGSIHYQCMDWRHVSEMLDAGSEVYSSLKNICVWDKGTGGMGSLYRSQHEFIFVFKNGTKPHINNVELGVHGRYRTNVWKYKGMHASNPQAKTLVKLHPTVKPVPMIMDALLDCSSPNGIVLDSFGGSGSTLIAAERTKRRARIIELEPKYCDVILYRWKHLTGKTAELVELKEVYDVK